MFLPHWGCLGHCGTTPSGCNNEDVGTKQPGIPYEPPRPIWYIQGADHCRACGNGHWPLRLANRVDWWYGKPNWWASVRMSSVQNDKAFPIGPLSLFYSYREPITVVHVAMATDHCGWQTKWTGGTRSPIGGRLLGLLTKDRKKVCGLYSYSIPKSTCGFYPLFPLYLLPSMVPNLDTTLPLLDWPELPFPCWIVAFIWWLLVFDERWTCSRHSDIVETSNSFM